MGDAFGGAVEVYGLDDCAQYPRSGGNLIHQSAGAKRQVPVRLPDLVLGDLAHVHRAAVRRPLPGYLDRGAVYELETVPSPATPASCGVINPGEGLGIGQSLSSCDGRFTLTLQPSGNLVLTQGCSTLWASNTTGAYAAEMMSGGDFVLCELVVEAGLVDGGALG